MAFPTTPTNGQQATVNGILYQWNSTKTAWIRVGSGITNLQGNTLSLNSQAVSVNPQSGALVVFGGTGVVGNLNVGGFITGNIGASNFDVVTRNLNSYPYVMNYTGSFISNVVYTTPSGIITKQYSYGNNQISSVAIFGPAISHIFTKNLVFSGNTLTGATYNTY